jgi:hypothetical protein
LLAQLESLPANAAQMALADKKASANVEMITLAFMEVLLL